MHNKTHLSASRLASAHMQVARHAGSRAAMETGRYISISSLDFTVGAGPAFSFSGIRSQDSRQRRRWHLNDARKPMMKIQMKEFGDQLTLQVEGRLAGAFVPELETCWQAACAHQPNRKISVDLQSVTCIDRAGRSLLQSMHRNGVGFLRAGLAIQDILEQVMESPECKH